MNKTSFSILICVTMLYTCQSETSMQKGNWAYPETSTVDQTDSYFGQEIKDPYRWLEDDNAPETEAWVQAQNDVTFDYLEKISFRDGIKKRLEELENYEKVSAPFKRGNAYYFFKNDGLQNQRILYRKASLEGESEVFFDPNKLSEDGTTSLAGASFSKDGKMFAYAISKSGSDWRTIYIMDVETQKQLSDKIEWARFTDISWREDGFYYQRYPEPQEGDEFTGAIQFGKTYYHKVGTPQSEDDLIFENPDNPNNRFGAYVSDDDRFLVIYSQESTHGNGLYVKDLNKPHSDFISIIENYENEHRVIGSKGNLLFIRTDLDAPKGRVVTVHASDPTPNNWVDIIPESENVLNAGMAGGRIFANYLVDAKTSVHQYNLDGSLEREVELPGIGSAGGFTGKEADTELFYTFMSFTVPAAIYRYEIASGKSTLYQQAQVAFHPENYITEQVFFKSKDGTRVPMFIVYKKGMEKNGKNPTWLYSYGGFNISMLPNFSASRLAWLEQGGIYAQPSIRGGGEYGDAWHKAGTKLQKQNVFDDFAAAGDYLIEEGYTSSDYLAMEGGSNGGLLIGATMNQRPELAKVAFPRVGVLDMLRYQYFTIGRAWSTDYGTSEDSEEMFQYLLNYSPLHNISTDTPYPATMVMTADHDDRVVPAHSFKYGAMLQKNAGWGPNPLLIRVETKAGHGSGTPIYKQIEQRADMYGFAFENMGLQWENAEKIGRENW